MGLFEVTADADADHTAEIADADADADADVDADADADADADHAEVDDSDDELLVAKVWEGEGGSRQVRRIFLLRDKKSEIHLLLPDTLAASYLIPLSRFFCEFICNFYGVLK